MSSTPSPQKGSSYPVTGPPAPWSQPQSRVGIFAPVAHGRRSRRPPSWTRPWTLLTPAQRDMFALSVFVKVLIFPAYHSTDFEVHRNWLAITYELPLREWYFEATSQWTLDYPPFFAYFSYLLSLPAAFLDPTMVSVHEGLEYASWRAKIVMRGTAVVTEFLVLGSAVIALLQPSRSPSQASMKRPDPPTWQLLLFSLFLHPGLIIVDHVHFQYNGFLFGVFLWSVWAAREDRPHLLCLLFSSLLNFKHINMYLAPAYAVFILARYALPTSPYVRRRRLAAGLDPSEGFFGGIIGTCKRLASLAVPTLLPFMASLLPLVLSFFLAPPCSSVYLAAHPSLADGLSSHPTSFGRAASALDMPTRAGWLGVKAGMLQLLGRLFPFSRGLNHAFWAPNFWALWTGVDRLLLKLSSRPHWLPSRLIFRLLHTLNPSFLPENFAASQQALTGASRGLVGDIEFAILPQIEPRTCFLVTLAAMGVFLPKLLSRPTYKSFLSSLVLCGWASFLFGWHVHEKAVLIVLIPFTLLAAEDYAHLRTFVLLNTAGTFALFTLLFTPAETPIKLLYTLAWSVVIYLGLERVVYRGLPSLAKVAVHALETVYLCLFPLLQVYTSIIHPAIFSNTATQQAAVPGNTTTADSESVFGSGEGVDAPSGSPMTPTTTGEGTMEFLPLMLVSLLCAVGVVWSYLRFLVIYLGRRFGEETAAEGRTLLTKTVPAKGSKAE